MCAHDIHVFSPSIFGFAWSTIFYSFDNFSTIKLLPPSHSTTNIIHESVSVFLFFFLLFSLCPCWHHKKPQPWKSFPALAFRRWHNELSICVCGFCSIRLSTFVCGFELAFKGASHWFSFNYSIGQRELKQQPNSTQNLVLPIFKWAVVFRENSCSDISFAVKIELFTKLFLEYVQSCHFSCF